MTEAAATITGRKLNARYTLLDRLGAGGQGEVWRAHDDVRGVDIALKVVNPTGREDEAWSALEHEYAIASRLDHPSILEVYPPERVGGSMVLPMELASGGDLRRLRGAGFLEIIPVLLEIAQALEHAHERGVVHRDLKPGNVLFDARGRARLADFGVAEASMSAVGSELEGATAGSATRDTNRHGFSPFTASPAQLRGEPPTPADDIYGLGALAYELLSGYPPHYPHFDKKRAIEERVPMLVPTRQIPPLLGKLVMHMLAKDPKKRPRRVREVIDELDASLNDTLTYDFDNVSPATPTASTVLAARGATASRADGAESEPGAAEEVAAPPATGQISRGAANGAADASARSFIWTPGAEDRRQSQERRGRRKEDHDSGVRVGLGQASPSGEPSSKPGASALTPGANVGAGVRADGHSTAAPTPAAPTRTPRRSGAEALARIDAALARAAAESATTQRPKQTQFAPITPAEAAAIVAAARAATSKPVPSSAPPPAGSTRVPDGRADSPSSKSTTGISQPTATHWTAAEPTIALPPLDLSTYKPSKEALEAIGESTAARSPTGGAQSRGGPPSSGDAGTRTETSLRKYEATVALPPLDLSTYKPSKEALDAIAEPASPQPSRGGAQSRSEAPARSGGATQSESSRRKYDATVALPPLDLSTYKPLNEALDVGAGSQSEAPPRKTASDATLVLPPLDLSTYTPSNEALEAIAQATAPRSSRDEAPSRSEVPWRKETRSNSDAKSLSGGPPANDAATRSGSLSAGDGGTDGTDRARTPSRVDPTLRSDAALRADSTLPGDAALRTDSSDGSFRADSASRGGTVIRSDAASRRGGAFRSHSTSRGEPPFRSEPSLESDPLSHGEGPLRAEPLSRRKGPSRTEPIFRDVAQPGQRPQRSDLPPPSGSAPRGVTHPATQPMGASPRPATSNISIGNYPDPEPIRVTQSINTRQVHTAWGDIPLDGLPKVTRLQPIRPRRWPWVFFGLLTGAAAAVYFWLPRFDTQSLPPEVAAIVEPLKAAITQDSSKPSDAAPGSTASATDTNTAAATSGSHASDSGAMSSPATGTQSPRATAASSSSSNSALTPTQTPPASATVDEQRLRQMRQTFDNRLAMLEARGAGVWGGREFAVAKTRAAESVGAHDAGNPLVSQERLTAAMKLLDTVERKAPQALAAQVATGEQALGAGQQEVAGQAFDLARRISPTDRRASDGQRRAQNLNAILPLLADAQNAEGAHDYARAAQDYSQALSLDPGNAAAKAGQARANAAFGDDNYAKAVGSGFAALGAGRLDEAHDSFVKARALNPRGAEASEGLRRVGAALTARGFASMRQRALGLEAQERWDEAQRTYEDVLAADPTLGFAQEGKARTTSRADLSLRLQQLIDRPDRLSSPGVKEDARALLETASAQSPQGPVIRSQIARLETLLPSFDRPVRLSLLSDNSTQVAISSIGSFGRFARRDIELRPGRYTVIGTRYGFRDVRREITVAPGQENQTIRVTCSDPI